MQSNPSADPSSRLKQDSISFSHDHIRISSAPASTYRTPHILLATLTQYFTRPASIWHGGGESTQGSLIASSIRSGSPPEFDEKPLTGITITKYGQKAPWEEETMQDMKNEAGKKSNMYRRLQWPCIFGLVLVLVCIIVIAILDQMHIIHVFTTAHAIPENADNVPSAPTPSPSSTARKTTTLLDPTELVIPALVSPSIYNCSNIPLRAPRNSTYYSNNELLRGADRCPEGSFRYTLTECDLIAVMSSNAQPFRRTLKPLLPKLLETLERYDLNCAPLRLASFLAVLRYETRSLTMKAAPKSISAQGYQSILEMFEEKVPELLSASDNVMALKGLHLDDLKSVATNAAKTISEQRDKPEEYKISHAEAATKAIGWWFKLGAKQALPSLPCHDLRIDSDRGLGRMKGPTGFYKVSQCVHGNTSAPGLAQRLKYYGEVVMFGITHWKCQMRECESETN
jgi:hypothetical protein